MVFEMMFQYSLFTLDWFLRIGLMILVLIFWIYTLVLGKNAADAGIDAKKNYFRAFSFFFLCYFLNYLQTEFMLADVFEYPAILYPNVFEDTFMGFITPTDDNIWLFLFFFLGAVPLSFAIEKYLLMHKKIPLTIVGIIALAANIVIFFFPNNALMTSIVILIDYLAIIAIVLTLLILYMRIAVMSSGKLRGMGLLMFFGLIFQVAAIFITSSDAVIGHSIALAGFFLIFISLIQMR